MIFIALLNCFSVKTLSLMNATSTAPSFKGIDVMNKIILSLLGTTLLSTGAFADTCKEVALTTNENQATGEHYVYSGDQVLTLSGRRAQAGKKTTLTVVGTSTTMAGGQSTTVTITDTYRDLVMQPYPGTAQGAPDEMTNGKVTLEIEQDWDPKTNLGEGVFVILTPDATTTPTTYFCLNAKFR
jgi:hypothetical protein